MALLGCFTVAATISEDLISQDIRKNLLLASMILGFIHLTFEIQDPWKITTTYTTSDQVGSTDPNPFIIQAPDENTNLFSDYGTSLFAIYLFLAGDSSALTPWPYKDNKILVLLMVSFSFLVVIYLMNLFIGLLNNEIEKDNNKVSYLLQKARILAEIELFYLLPYQRRRESWFPDVIYYHADVDVVRRRVNELIKDNEWGSVEFPEMNKKLLDQIKIQK
ncbi:15512_t:CDS:2 [Funneliformis caledonium]|uniref:15512_t:CDS:1 n=1 Tax=Funneliformis caledonium TaxID=1117310 RepID=A0A9N9AVP7_9GLOM|nr:15512_t:CDS:2 [Funneliformis caledonium]